MTTLRRHVTTWWDALLRPERAAQLVLAGGGPGFGRFLASAVFVLYCVYGLSMGLFRGCFPSIVSGIKLPLLYLASLAICFPAFYALNGTAGPRLRLDQCIRLLLLAMSGNAVALASYTPISLFFALTTSKTGYLFISLMHVAVFAVSGAVSVAVIALVFRSAARLTGGCGGAMALIWGVLYAFVGTELAWVLRPWIGWWDEAYTPFRPLERSFVEAVWFMISQLR